MDDVLCELPSRISFWRVHRINWRFGQDSGCESCQILNLPGGTPS